MNRDQPEPRRRNIAANEAFVVSGNIQYKDSEMPPLIRFVLKWTVVGVAVGWAFLAALFVLDVGGIGGLLWRSTSPGTVIFIMALSFGISAAQITLLAAVLLRSDFGGNGPAGMSRLERWKAGHSAEVEPYQ
jgi:hypothetical protein